ncbi:AI-2E family transporter [Fusibacter paucivorans]|uniref:AI-2E family transporter n=1 Tax=Fusibacter paucivorans TaxID=76009 RepID=A0ABS5PT27_9FIRM|nr:AI-2E family transporter [Fusibacter paucivorans]MBS7528236.1 AI-2E family transporter [Fusibacter paucivorans]
MNFKDWNIIHFSKLVLIGTTIVLFLTRTPIWDILFKGITPLLYAFIITYILDYLVRYIEKHTRLNRTLSILLTFIIFISLITLVGALIIPRIVSAVNTIIIALGNMDIDLNQIFRQDFNNIYLNEIQQSIINTVTPMVQKITNATGNFVLLIVNKIQQITSGLISFIVSLIISIYMLADKTDLVARIKRFIYANFNDQQASVIFDVSYKAHRIFKAFVIGKLIDSLIIGCLSFVIFTIFHFEFALLIAFIIGLTNMIPYFGPFLGAVPASIITYIAAPDQPILVVWMLIAILVIQQLDGWVIGPYILGDSVGVSAFWIIVAVTVGGATFGVVGMFMGVPTLVLIKTIIEDNIQHKLHKKGYDGLESKNIRAYRKSKSSSKE